MDPKLYKAAMEGNVDVLNYLSQLEIQVTPNRNTALHVAAMFGKTLCVKEILRNCSSLLTRVNIKCETPLHLAAKEGYAEVVLALIECAKELGRHNEENGDDDQGVKNMLRMTNENEDTALHEAVRYGHLDVVKLLVSNDPEFSHQRNKDEETPLYLAVEKGLHDFLSEILNTCKSTSPGGPKGTTALHMAVILDDEESVKKLLDWNPYLSHEGDLDGRTPLHYAAYLGHVQRAGQLLDLDRSTSIAYLITSKEDGNNTALHLAASQGRWSVMDVLLSHTPDCFEMANSVGQNIIHIAIENKKFRAIRHLERKYSAFFHILVNQKDNDGNTPLHLLSASGRLLPLLPEIALNPRVEKMSFNKKSRTPRDIFGLNFELDLPALLWRLAVWSIMLQILAAKAESYGLTNLNILDVFTNLNKCFGPRGKRNLIRRYKEEKENKEHVFSVHLKTELGDLKKVCDTNLIVASLIATVTFAAGFTLPGGYNSDSGPNQGMAVLTGKVAFQAFIITDTLALMLSSAAVFLYFLGTTSKISRLLSWTAFMIANHILAAALGTMMIAFVTGLYCVLAPSSSLAICACVIGSIFLFIVYMGAEVTGLML